MLNLVLLLQISLGIIFLTSAISKLSDMRAHRIKVKNYNILPLKLVKPFSKVDPILELIGSILLIINIYYPIGAGILCLLTFSYTIAISINIMRGNTDIDCGCGGLIGSHKLSNALIMRNISIIILLLFVIAPIGLIDLRRNQLSYGEVYFQLVGLSIFIIMFFKCLGYLKSIRNISEGF